MLSILHSIKVIRIINNRNLKIFVYESFSSPSKKLCDTEMYLYFDNYHN